METKKYVDEETQYRVLYASFSQLFVLSGLLLILGLLLLPCFRCFLGDGVHVIEFELDILSFFDVLMYCFFAVGSILFGNRLITECSLKDSRFFKWLGEDDKKHGL